MPRLPRLLALAIVPLVLSACAGMPVAGTNSGRFEARSVEVDGSVHHYQVFVPAPRFREGPTPVVLFLHGSGERGSDNRAQLDVGLGDYLRRHRRDFPALVVLPQVPDGEEWTGTNVDVALAALDQTSDDFGGDPGRTYVTGLSMGGYGAWEAALADPSRFAAVVTVSGALHAPDDEPPLRVTQVEGLKHPYAAVAERLAGVHVWMFHGAEDDEVPVHDDRRLFKAFEDAGDAARYTEFPDRGHAVWDDAYDDPDLWDWLFSKQKS